MNNRPLEVQELIQALLEARQPHARVVVRGDVTCDSEHDSYEDIHFTQRVTGVRTECNAVILEVEQ